MDRDSVLNPGWGCDRNFRDEKLSVLSSAIQCTENYREHAEDEKKSKYLLKNIKK